MSKSKYTRVQEEVGAWQDVTFIHGSVGSKLHHMVDEIEEARKAPGDLLEWADIMMLFMGASRLAGFTMDEILTGVKAKLIINKKREWGEPDERGVVKHKRRGLDMTIEDIPMGKDIDTELIRMTPEEVLARLERIRGGSMEPDMGKIQDGLCSISDALWGGELGWAHNWDGFVEEVVRCIKCVHEPKGGEDA
jgi:hypothetical protein